jgi:hypothetical protein
MGPARSSSVREGAAYPAALLGPNEAVIALSNLTDTTNPIDASSALDVCSAEVM